MVPGDEMLCRSYDADYSALLDGELTPEREAELRAHVDSCARCQARLEALRRVDVDLSALPAPPVASDLRARLQARIDAEGSAALVAETPPSDEVVDARRRGIAVERALAELPARQRAALLQGAVEGRSYAEIAKALEVTEKAVKALVHRARSNLAAALDGGEG